MEIAEILNSEFEKRKRKNNRYSLRAFAKFLNIDPTALLRIMQEERIPTLAICSRIIKALQLEHKYKTEDIKAGLAAKKQQIHLLSNSFNEADFDKLIQPKHLYVLSALRATTYPFTKIKSHLCKSCDMSEAEFNQIIKDLLSIGAIKSTTQGIELIEKHKSTMAFPFTSEKRRTLQKEFLTKAIQAIDEIPFPERENATLTLSLNKNDWPQVQKILKDARAKINRLSEKKQPADTVYNICMAAYPIVKLS